MDSTPKSFPPITDILHSASLNTSFHPIRERSEQLSRALLHAMSIVVHAALTGHAVFEDLNFPRTRPLCTLSIHDSCGFSYVALKFSCTCNPFPLTSLPTPFFSDSTGNQTLGEGQGVITYDTKHTHTHTCSHQNCLLFFFS